MEFTELAYLPEGKINKKHQNGCICEHVHICNEGLHSLTILLINNHNRSKLKSLISYNYQFESIHYDYVILSLLYVIGTVKIRHICPQNLFFNFNMT